LCDQQRYRVPAFDPFVLGWDGDFERRVRTRHDVHRVRPAVRDVDKLVDGAAVRADRRQLDLLTRSDAQRLGGAILIDRYDLPIVVGLEAERGDWVPSQRPRPALSAVEKRTEGIEADDRNRVDGQDYDERFFFG